MTDNTVGHDVQLPVRSQVRSLFGPLVSARPTLDLTKILAAWSRQSLSTRFIFASVFVICATMFHIGAWVDSRIKSGIVSTSAAATAKLIEHAINNHLPDLMAGTAPPNVIALVTNAAFDDHVLELKVWSPDGVLVYTNATTSPVKSIATKPFGSGLTSALSGQIIANFGYTRSFAPNAASPDPTLYVFAPLRDADGRIKAAAEFHQNAAALVQELASARRQSWVVVGLCTLGMLGLLYGIVHRGSQLILQQQSSLRSRIVEQGRLIRRNEALRERLAQAHQSSHLVSDRMLRRVGADLHDGPAQLLSFALLRLDELSVGSAASKDGNATLEAIREATADALAELRQISTGVSIPHLEQLSAMATINSAIDNHERRTKTLVARNIEGLPAAVPLAVRTCLYRSVQEGLNNASRHANAQGQAVDAHSEGANIYLAIKDTGPGFVANDLVARENALGLVGLRSRTESLGGTINIHSVVGKGTTISLQIPIKGIP